MNKQKSFGMFVKILLLAIATGVFAGLWGVRTQIEFASTTKEYLLTFTKYAIEGFVVVWVICAAGWFLTKDKKDKKPQE